MTDATVQEVEEVVEAEQKSEPLRIPIVKAKGEFLELDPDVLNLVCYRELLVQGGKTVLNRGMTKITKAAYPDPAKLKEAAIAKAKENLEALYAGKIRIAGGAKGDKVPREVMTEARRMAKAIVKQQIKDAGYKISSFEAKDITAAANSMLQETPALIERARKEVDERSAVVTKGFDPHKLKKSEKMEAKAEKKRLDAVLSAAKAQGVASRGQAPRRPTN